jgi:hypothetical protein
MYSGDSNNLGSSSTVMKETVNSVIGTTTKVSTSGSPSFVKQTVTFTANITSATGSIPDGEVITFSDSTSPMGTALTAGGVATFQTSTLSAKSHTIHASYPGDVAHKPSSGTVQQVVILYPATISLSSSPSSSVYGQPVTLAAAITSSAPGGPTGTLTFKNGTTTLGTAALNAATASLTTSKLPAGNLILTANYSGDGQTARTSTTTSQTVQQATTSTSLQSSTNPSVAGQLVRLTAIVTCISSKPTGSVTWMDGTTVIGSTNLSSGKASFSTSTLGVGVHSMTAVYKGTINIAGSTSSVLLQTVR